MKNIIFTDIDGVFNTIYNTKWNRISIELYNSICKEFNLNPVITSTWRKTHTKEELQNIFTKNGITVNIYDITPVMNNRGEEIKNWLSCNEYSKYVIIDDNVVDIEKHKLKNIIKCRSWIGFTKEEYNSVKNILID